MSRLELPRCLFGSMSYVEAEPHGGSAGSEGFEAFFRRMYPQLVRIAYRVLGDREAASDVAQDVMLAAYARYPEDLSNPAAWVRSAAVHGALNHARGHRRRDRREARQPSQQSVPQPEEQALQADERRSVREALSRLTKEKATILVLRHSGLSYLEVAEAMGISPASVGTTLRRAEEQFRKEVTP